MDPAEPDRHVHHVLLVGATGFIGRHVQQALQHARHQVTAAARRASPGVMQVDLAQDTRLEDWLPRLQGIDVVVNAAGAFVDRPGNQLDTLHGAGPVALFDAAVRAGVTRIVQISALGAEGASTAYFSTKQQADRHLLGLPLDAAILRPSLVFGIGGASADIMLSVASMPLLVVPRVFRSRVQPVHVDDLAAAVVALVNGAAVPRWPMAVVGPESCTLTAYLQALRRQIGLRAARIIEVPDALMGLGRLVPSLARSGLLSADAMRMLAAGSRADPAPLAALLGRPPRAVSQFIPRSLAPAVATQATLAWITPLLCMAIAALWFISGLVSLGIFPLEQSYAMLAATGIPPALQPLLLFGAAATDIALGFAVLLAGGRPLVWRLQILLVVFYTVVITVWLPQFWLHPFGPLSKNIPLLASFYMLQRLAVPRWNT